MTENKNPLSSAEKLTILNARGWTVEESRTGGRYPQSIWLVYKDGKQALSRYGYAIDETAINAAWTADKPARQVATIREQAEIIQQLKTRVAELEALLESREPTGAADPAMTMAQAIELVENGAGVFVEGWYSVTNLLDGSEHPYYLAGGEPMMPASYERHYLTALMALSALLYLTGDTAGWQDAAAVTE